MKCRRLPSFSMSIEALEIRDLKSADSVTQCVLAPIDDSRIVPVPSPQFGDVAVTSEAYQCPEQTATSEEIPIGWDEREWAERIVRDGLTLISDPAASEEIPAWAEAANEALRNALVHEVTRGTMIDIGDGDKFTFDSPTSGTLYRRDGTRSDFEDIDFTYGNHGGFTEYGPFQTLMYARYNGKWGFFGGIGEFHQARGTGYVEVFFGGRKVDGCGLQAVPRLTVRTEVANTTVESSAIDASLPSDPNDNFEMAAEVRPAEASINSDATSEPESMLDAGICNWTDTEHESTEVTRRAASSPNWLILFNDVNLELLDDLFDDLFASEVYFN